MAAALSHEIGQPLTAARARARTIERLIEMNDLTRLRENLGPLVAQIDHAADILQHMREFLRRGSSERKPVSWKSIATGAQVFLAPLAAEKKVSLKIQTNSALPDALCDRVQIEQVVINLAGNAIEAISTPGQEDGEIQIAAALAKNGRDIEISVRDNGPGIDPSVAENLFNALKTTRHDGTGLGLAICTSIIEAHHGLLWLEASQKGNTEFRFVIPVAVNGDKV